MVVSILFKSHRSLFSRVKCNAESGTRSYFNCCTSIIAMGTIISVIITTIVVYTSFKEVDQNYLKVLQTFGATRLQSFKEAVLPASFPTIISTLKVNVGLSWVGVIVGEFLVSSKGL